MKDVIDKIKELALAHDTIDPELIAKKDVKLGLRNADGTGVIVGITRKGRVYGYEKVHSENGKTVKKPMPGKLFYCGYDVEKIVEGLRKKDSYGFEEVIYLLLTGQLPNEADLTYFSESLAARRHLSKLERMIIVEEVLNDNQMYGLHSVISHLARCDPNADTRDLDYNCEQLINLIAKFPTIVAYNYNVMRFRKGGDLMLLMPKPDKNTAENFLYMLHGIEPDPYDAKIFDIMMVLHAEHGGGNNSTFSVRTVSSSGANTYMSIAAGIASLSGYLHGGANEMVMRMIRELKKNINDWGDDDEIRAYLEDILDGRKGDGRGKIYGLGHAVYTMSDPRAMILREIARDYAQHKGQMEEFEYYEKVDRIATELLSERKKTAISVNVDFYSGLLYKMMGIPIELYTPIFAMSRVVGWAAHRIEQIVQGKIIRPAYISPDIEEEYKMLPDRE